MVVPGLIGLVGWITGLIRAIGWMLLTPLLRRWLGTSLTILVLTLVLSQLLTLSLGFELQVEGSENIWFISGWFSSLIPRWCHEGTSLSGMANKDVVLLKE
jgi:hypothetical protein